MSYFSTTELSTFVQTTQNVQNLTSTANLSIPLKDCPPLRVTPILISAGIAALGIIIGNSLVILAIANGNSKFFRPMYWFIIYLSCSDLLVGFMLLWNFCLAGIFDIHNALTNFTILQGVWVTSATSSVLGISLLSIDRYMQVVHRPLYARYFNPFSVGVALLFAVFIPIFVFLVAPLAFNWSCLERCQCFEDKYMECEPLNECSLIIPPFKKSYILACLIFIVSLVPWPITMYSLIFIKARKATQVVHAKMRHRDFRLLQTLVAILIAFLATFVPCTIIMTIDYLTVGKDEKLVDYALYVFLLASLNSVVNPILYIWRIPAIRLSLQRKVCCLCIKPRSQTADSRITRTESRHNDASTWKRPSPGPVSPMKRRSMWFFRDFRFNPSLSDGSRCSSPEIEFRTKKKIVKSNRKSADLNSVHARDVAKEACLSPLVPRDMYQGSSFNLPVFGEKYVMTSCDVTNNAVVLLHTDDTRDDKLLAPP